MRGDGGDRTSGGDNRTVRAGTTDSGDLCGMIGGRSCSLEIGMGKGRFLTETARRASDEFFIGVDVKEERVLSAAKKIDQLKLENVRLILGDADMISGVIEPGVIDVIYLNFSDPWPKKKHAKRRFSSPKYLEMYRRLLRPDGRVVMKTDNLRLFEYSLEQMSECGWNVVTIDRDHRSPEHLVTEFEKRFLEKKLPIYFVEAEVSRDR